MATSKRSSSKPPAVSPSKPNNQRRHTRFERQLAVRVIKRDSATNAVNFSAPVDTKDISVSGVFLRSTFFLRDGLELELEIELPEMETVVCVTGVVARVIDESAHGPSGFAIRFTRFHDDAEIYLRAYLAQGNIYEFVEQQVDELFPRLPKRELPKLVKLIVRWEIFQENMAL